MKRILVIPDTHGSAIHPYAISFLEKVNYIYEPNVVVHLGDEVDFANWAKFALDPDEDGPAAELKNTIKSLQPLYELFPDLLLCEGNHTLRLHRRAFEAGIPSKALQRLSDILGAPKGWKWSDRHIIDNIVFEHGIGLSGKYAALRAAELNRMSTVIGHVHAFAGISWTASKKDIIFGMNCGCLIDNEHSSMRYAKYMRTKPILGCGFIENGIPRFIPMILDSLGRWIGRV